MKRLEDMFSGKKADILAALQADILRLQGFKQGDSGGLDPGLGPVNSSFPNQSFPTGAVHEFLVNGSCSAAPTCGFVAGILAALSGDKGTALWIGSQRKVFPPALSIFGVKPQHMFFINLRNQQHILWAIEEALKCTAVSAVIGEVSDLSFIASRRLQLAVEESRVTGFVIRQNPRNLSTTACISRWRISSLASEQVEDLPGVGYPAWRVELLRIRNGKPGAWDLMWTPAGFRPVPQSIREESGFSVSTTSQNRKAG